MNTYEIKFNNGAISTTVGKSKEDATGWLNLKSGVEIVSVAEIKPDSGKYGKGHCHYCGQDATGWDFFGAPICPECGG